MRPGTCPEPQRLAVFSPGGYGDRGVELYVPVNIIRELPPSLEAFGQGLETPNSFKRAQIEKDLLFFSPLCCLIDSLPTVKPGSVGMLL